MATITGSRSGLYWRNIPGGLPSIVDVSKFCGNIFWVDSNASGKGDSTGKGYHPDYPFATMDYAVGRCTANQGDVILVLPGHVETVSAAAGLDLDVAGITIIFLGEGNARGRISFGTVVGADMDVDAADITMINPRFVAALDALTGPIDVNAARFKIVNGTCEDGTTINTTDWVVADANADDLDIDGLAFVDGDAGGTQKQSFIQIAAATRPKLKRIRATGDFGTGVIENGTAWVDALLDDCVLENTAAGPVVGILLQATSSGTARNVHVRVASGTTYVTADNDMQWFDSEGVGTDGAAGDQIGTVASASIEGKVDSVGTQAGSVGTQVGSVGTLTTSVGTQTGSVGTQATSVGTQVGSVGTQAGSVGTLTTSVGTQATSIGTQVGSVGTLVTTDVASVGTQATSVGTLTTSVGTQAGSLGTQVTSVGTLTTSVGTQAGSVGTQVGSVGTLTTSVGTQAGSVGTQVGSVGTLATSVGTQLGTGLTNLGGSLVRKTITYTGGVSYAAFTVTGCVAVKVVGYVTTALTNHADTTSVGTATSAAGLIAATAGTAMQTTGQAWVDNAPSKFESFPTAHSIIGDGEDIAVVGTANLAAGVVELYCFYTPLSADGAVVAA